jgi:hypothetical protein
MGYICFIQGLQCKDEEREPDWKRLVHIGSSCQKHEYSNVMDTEAPFAIQ